MEHPDQPKNITPSQAGTPVPLPLGVDGHFGPMQVMKLSDNATLPFPIYPGVCILSSSKDLSIPPKGMAAIQTDLFIQIPAETCAHIAPIDNLAQTCGINVAATAFTPANFNLTVTLFNHGDNPYLVTRGVPVALLQTTVVADLQVQENK